MKKLNCVFAVALISLLMVQSGYCAKKSKKTAKTTEQPVASETRAEMYVFPVDAEKPEYRPVSRVLTGIFTQKQQEKAIESDKAMAGKSEEIHKKELPPRKLNERTIAWITPMNIYYHDPMNNCLKTEERNWAEDNKELIGLEPCPDCFKKRDMIPSFIKKQCGNLDIADANNLLVNSKFIEWAKERMPIKDINFISGVKVIVYPNLDMTHKGMYQLAKETQMAYLRQTWRVIEVWVKADVDSVPYVSSFSASDELLGVVQEQNEKGKSIKSEVTTNTNTNTKIKDKKDKKKGKKR